MYSVKRAEYNVQCTKSRIQCTVYIVQCTVYNVQCTHFLCIENPFLEQPINNSKPNLILGLREFYFFYLFTLSCCIMVFWATFNRFCILLLTFNNPMKVCFSYKKRNVSIQTHTTQIQNSISFIQKSMIIRFLKIIGLHLYHFCKALVNTYLHHVITH